MKRMALILAAAISGPAVAEPPGVSCEEVRALATGAEEAVPFRTLRDREASPMLGRASCFFSDAGSYTCGFNLAEREETRETFASAIHACLPGSVRSTRQNDYDSYDVVTLGRLEARVVEAGTDRAHVGRSITIYVRSLPPG